MNTDDLVLRVVLLIGAGWLALGCTEISTDAALPTEAQTFVSQELRNGNRNSVRSLRKLRPFVHCVEARGDELLAHFGYRNRGDVTLSVPIGHHNAFHPNPVDRGQSTLFPTGRHDDVVQAAFGGRGIVVWVLGLREAVASRHGRRCRTGARCGDGQVSCWTDRNGSTQCEQCDDGNATSGDGCSSTCMEEPEWACDAPGQPCHRVVCGDGYVDCMVDAIGNEYCEDCDDGNVEAGDGCSASCVVEAGWSCPDAGQPCATLCGNGAIDCWPADGGQQCEACDDGNEQPGDGCSGSCVVEADWTCPDAGQPCATLCGNGAIDCWPADGGQQCEACDDGNAQPSDGCSRTCDVEPGWTCSSSGVCVCIGLLPGTYPIPVQSQQCMADIGECPPFPPCGTPSNPHCCTCPGTFTCQGAGGVARLVVMQPPSASFVEAYAGTGQGRLGGVIQVTPTAHGLSGEGIVPCDLYFARPGARVSFTFDGQTGVATINAECAAGHPDPCGYSINEMIGLSGSGRIAVPMCPN